MKQTSINQRKKYRELCAYLTQLSEQELTDLVIEAGKIQAKKSILLKVIKPVFRIRITRENCTNNEKAAIHYEKCNQLSKVSNRKLGELIGLELVRRFEASENPIDTTEQPG
ncbi:MAG: hypothetical protein F4039_08325 [Gammaproteobacteria bacterium]|nr:hypothetical protein [Gammaproteobacteria bacterium]MXX94405.1 hypothetical protein [Gammaproteobacteria bacterium]MYF52698.1 hypothetical protein [Gammaproteobacteria bacterium]MYK44078.1 hypothetical protein [Gammaproteobacteria bacterium]